MFLQRCPNCFSEPKLKKRNRKYFVECDGDCWTQTDKYWTPEEAAEAWNRLVKTEHEDDE